MAVLILVRKLVAANRQKEYSLFVLSGSNELASSD